MARKHRRNYLPTFLVNLGCWFAWVLWVLLVSPEQGLQVQFLSFKLSLPLNIIFFLLILTLSLTLTLALLLGNTRRGFLLTLFVDGFLVFRLLREATWINLLLLFAILFTLELYFSSKEKNRLENRQKSN